MFFWETAPVYCEIRTEHKTIYKGSVRTSQETKYVFTTELNRLMLFGETVTVYYEIRISEDSRSCRC
jgi:hypothetical protein